MAYTPIDKGENFFNTVLWTGNGSQRTITVGFQPGFSWLKNRGTADWHKLSDAIRGANKVVASNASNTEGTETQKLQSFVSTGFTIGTDGEVNGNGSSQVAWNWVAADPPKKTYIVKVVSDGGNKYRFDDFGTNAVTLELSEGGTFIFDQSDSSNNGHPLRFSTTSNGTHAGGSIYTTGVTVSGTPGQAGAKTVIVVAASAPTLYYFCTVHSGMGGQANTPVTNSFTNLDGSIQSNISPNSTSKFSIVSYTGNGTGNSTIGHGLGATPKFIIVKNRTTTQDWGTLSPTFVSASDSNILYLSKNDAQSDGSNVWGTSAAFNNTTFTVGDWTGSNQSSSNFIAYCFSDVQGFSKIGSYIGNGNADGTFIYTGFKPAFMMVKRATGGSGNWHITDNKRDPFNVNDAYLSANANSAESDFDHSDFLSNGIKFKTNNDGFNQDGNTYIYMSFAENPFVSAAGIPVTAR